MLAVGIEEFGGPEVLKSLEIPDPTLGPGEVMVRVHAAAVNPTDTLRRSGTVAEMRQVEGPYVLGMDFAGVVEQAGPGDDAGMQLGDRVMGAILPHGQRGAYSERLAIKVSHLMRVPEGMDLHEAATLPMNGLTALAAIEALGVDAGDTLAVTGAAGVFGGYVIQLAKARNARVVADASNADLGVVRARGADIVVPRGPEVARRIREHLPDGVRHLVDGAVLDDLVSDAVADGGAIVTLRHYAGPTDRDVRWIPVRVRHHLSRIEMIQGVEAAAVSGILTPRLAEVIACGDAGAAHRRLAEGGLRGRLVLDFSASQ